jgi:hypothetical protein
MTPSLLPTRRTRTLLAGLAAVAFAGGATAGSAQADGFVVNDPALNVPADKVEHTIRDFSTTGSYGRHTLDELWLGSDKAHWISRDATSGKIVRETTFSKGKSLTYDAGENTITEMNDKVSAPPWQTMAQQAAIWKHAFEQGVSRKIGDTTALGRPALVLESVPEKWKTDEPSQTTTMVVDAETFVVYDIKSVLPRHDFTQDDILTSFEMLDRTAAGEGVFAMTAHDGAKRAVAARKHAAKRKVTKKQASKKHAKHHAAKRRL